MRILMDADALIKLAVSTAKEGYLSGLTVFVSPPAAQESTRGPSGGRTPDSHLIEKNIQTGRIRVAGSGRGRGPPPVRPGEDGDHGTLEWSTSPGIDMVVTDDRHLLGRLSVENAKGSTLCESIITLVRAGIRSKPEGASLLDKLSGSVRERERVEALRRIQGLP